jgi:hypothetical protein
VSLIAHFARAYAIERGTRPGAAISFNDFTGAELGALCENLKFSHVK